MWGVLLYNKKKDKTVIKSFDNYYKAKKYYERIIHPKSVGSYSYLIETSFMDFTPLCA